MNGFGPKKREVWWRRVPAPMAFQRYATAAATGWGMVASMGLRNDAADWTRYFAVGAALTMAAVVSWGLAIVMRAGERALFRPFQQRRPLPPKREARFSS